MAELRWVLLALGILFIVTVYLWSQGVPQRWLAPLSKIGSRKEQGSDRIEPAVAESEESITADKPSATEPLLRQSPPETIVTLRFIPSSKEISCDKVILALRAAGLKHGRYGIFHKHPDEFTDEPSFSVANLTEPGSFDLSNLTAKIRGVSLFMVVPGPSNPIERFDEMVATARDLARELGGELRDEKGSSWSIQRERYVREEIIEYCHAQDHPSIK